MATTKIRLSRSHLQQLSVSRVSLGPPSYGIFLTSCSACIGMPASPHSPKPASLFLTLQLVAVVLAAAVSVWTNPARLVWLPALVLFFVTYVWAKQQTDGCSRTTTKRLSLRSGLLFGVLFAVAFIVFAFTTPEQLDLPPTWCPYSEHFWAPVQALAQ